MVMKLRKFKIFLFIFEENLILTLKNFHKSSFESFLSSLNSSYPNLYYEKLKLTKEICKMNLLGKTSIKIVLMTWDFVIIEIKLAEHTIWKTQLTQCNSQHVCLKLFVRHVFDIFLKKTNLKNFSIQND